MRRLGPALALLLVASVALANPGDARVSVTLKADVVDVHAAGEEMVAIYGGRLIETNAQTVVLEISIARSGLVARDPRVASVTVLGSASSQPHAAAAPAPRPLAPRANNNDPCTTAPIGLPRCTGTYQYDGAGNIKAIGNDVFVYDAVSRLKSATLASAGGVGESYDYDAFGNLKKITAATPADLRPDLTTDPLTNHLKTVTTAKYDEAGNLTSWMGHEYTYDAANMLTEMNDGVADMMYVYTADDERIATLTVSNSGYVATWRIRGLDNKVLREFQEENYTTSTQPWTWKRDYVYRGDLLLASYVTSPTGTTKRLDYHLDHLGTPRLITDEGGQQVSVHHYYPFGREITAAAGETMKFTGHERDFAPYDYQDYMHARYDNPYLGRFLSVDPVFANLHRPQSFNRYAYVSNNPINLTDPTGKFGEDSSSAEEMVDKFFNDQPLGPWGKSGDPIKDFERQRQMAKCHLCAEASGGSGESGKTLPNDPAGLGPEWQKDPNHKDPNGERYRDPDGNVLDWHPATGDKGWKSKDHWHYRPGGEDGKKHLKPGDQIPRIITAIGLALGGLAVTLLTGGGALLQPTPAGVMIVPGAGRAPTVDEDGNVHLCPGC